MIVLVMTFWNLVLTQQIYSEETNGAHAHNRDRVPLKNRAAHPHREFQGYHRVYLKLPTFSG